MSAVPHDDFDDDEDIGLVAGLAGFVLLAIGTVAYVIALVVSR